MNTGGALSFSDRRGRRTRVQNAGGNRLPFRHTQGTKDLCGETTVLFLSAVHGERPGNGKRTSAAAHVPGAQGSVIPARIRFRQEKALPPSGRCAAPSCRKAGKAPRFPRSGNTRCNTLRDALQARYRPARVPASRAGGASCMDRYRPIHEVQVPPDRSRGASAAPRGWGKRRSGRFQRTTDTGKRTAGSAPALEQRTSLLTHRAAIPRPCTFSSL